MVALCLNFMKVIKTYTHEYYDLDEVIRAQDRYRKENPDTDFEDHLIVTGTGRFKIEYKFKYVESGLPPTKDHS